MRVEDQMRALRQQEAAIRATPCVRCGHSWGAHNDGTSRCWHPRVPALSDDKPCRCKKFVDPDDQPDLFPKETRCASLA